MAGVLSALVDVFGCFFSFMCPAETPAPFVPYCEKINDSTRICSISGFLRSYSVGVDAKGKIYVPDMQANNIVIFDSKLSLLGAIDILKDKIVHIPVANGASNRPLDSADMLAPHCVSFDALGNMYVVEFKGNRVRKVSPNGDVTLVFKTMPQMKEPVVAYIEEDNYLYVGVYGSSQIIKFDPKNGEMIGWLGKVEGHSGYDSWRKTGIPVAGNSFGALFRPHSARLGPDNMIYIVDTWNHRIVRYSYDGKFMGWVGVSEDGHVVSSWDMSSTKAIQSSKLGGFSAPVEMEIDAQGNIYIADNGNHRIVKMSKEGKTLGWLGKAKGKPVEAVWRTTGEPISGDELMAFKNPYGIRLNGNNLYVSDTHNQRILVISSDELFVN